MTLPGHVMFYFCRKPLCSLTERLPGIFANGYFSCKAGAFAYTCENGRSIKLAGLKHLGVQV
jgi:hypothetical protein